MERGEPAQPYFEDLQVGDEIPTLEYGPLTIVDTVRWAGYQENWARLHYDRDYVREHSGLPTFIASGAFRQSLMIRCITDWVGPRGRLNKLSLRHTAPTHEGHLMRFSGRLTEKSGDNSLTLDLEGTNQDGQTIMTGRCTVTLPSRGSGNGSAA